MSCYSCGGNPNTFCGECNYPKDTWIAPVDKLPDPFMGDFDHLFRTPDGNMYALAPDRSGWIPMGGAGGAVQNPQNLELDNSTRELTITKGNTVTLPNDTQNLSINGRTITISKGNSINLPEDRDTVYNDAELRRRIKAVEDKADNFVSGVTVSREGNKVKLTYTFVNGAPKEVEFEDKDTIVLAYDDTALKARVKALEDKPDKDTVYNDKPLRDRVTALENKPDRDNQTLALDPNTRSLSISGGNSVTLPNDKQTIKKEGNKLILSNGGGEVELPQPNNTRPYDDSPLVNRVKALEAKEDKDTKYSATGRGLILNDKNQFSLDIKRTWIMDRPYNADGIGVKLTPGNRFDLDLPNHIAYNTDYNGRIQSNATLQSTFLFNAGGFIHNYTKDGVKSETFQQLNSAVSVYDLYAVRAYGGFTLLLHKGVTIEGNIYGRWVDDLDSNKPYFAISARIVWDVNVGSHVERYEHHITKEELDSEEPIEIEVIEDGSTKRMLHLTLDNTRFEIRSAQGTIALKDPSDSNYYYPENIRYGVKHG